MNQFKIYSISNFVLLIVLASFITPTATAQEPMSVSDETVVYMVDDFFVFGLAIWGYSKLESHGHKYSQLSLLVGGGLMLLLGALLVFAPALLVL